MPATLPRRSRREPRPLPMDASDRHDAPAGYAFAADSLPRFEECTPVSPGGATLAILRDAELDAAPPGPLV